MIKWNPYIGNTYSPYIYFYHDKMGICYRMEVSKINYIESFPNHWLVDTLVLEFRTKHYQL